MGATPYRVLDADSRADLQNDRQTFALDVLEGLSESPKRLPSRYLYDDEGSRLFAAIMETEDYYPAACETEILTTQRGAILDRFAGRPVNLVDLGAGNGKKTLLLLEYLVSRGADVRYVPIDISEEAMRLAIDVVGSALPSLTIDGMVAEYADGIRWLGLESGERTNLVMFLGSNIGNFPKVQARRFLRQLWNLLNEGDYLFTGFDLRKDIDVLLGAYNDSEGLTHKFNLNLLSRINRELGADFNLQSFDHYGTYDVRLGAMTSYIVSKIHQKVYIESLQHSFEFQSWEPIQTEYSYKYLDEDIEALAEYTGYEIVGRFYDGKRYFADSLWRVRGRNVVPSISIEESSQAGGVTLA